MGGLFGGSSGGTNTSDTPLSSVSIQSSANGLSIQRIFGTTRVKPNLIWYGEFTAVPHTETQSSGGGKGGGAPQSTNTTYTYTASFMLALGSGPAQAIPRAWIDKSEVNPASLFTLFYGQPGQQPWAHLVSNHPDQALAYKNLIYAAAAGYNLGTSANLPNHNFEVMGECVFGNGIVDADPADIIDGIVNDPLRGVPNAPDIYGLDSYSNYCVASGIFLSPCYDTATAAATVISDLLQLTNSGCYYSENVLKIVPYGDAVITGNGSTYTPNLTPVADFTDDDFLFVDGEDPVKIQRNSIAKTSSTSSDAYNQVSIEYLNRANAYQAETITAQDPVSIDTFGLIPMSAITAHQIADGAVAGIVTDLILQRAVNVRAQYSFSLGWQWCDLEPTDIVTLTDTVLGLDHYPVRIISIEEDETGQLSLVAEDAPPGVSSAISRAVPQGNGYSVDMNADPGPVAAVCLFEPPISLLSGTGLEVWAGVTGRDEIWGGCNVWASFDGESYQRLGTVTAPARVGHLTADLATGSAASINVKLDGKGGQLLSASAEAAQALATLFYVGGTSPEFLAYQNAQLVAANAYTLTGLVRGAYGSTDATHQVGDQCIRVDEAIIKSGQIDVAMVGRVVRFKFQSFNVFAAGLQDLSALPEYTHVISGWSLKSPLANVQNVVSVFRAGLTVIVWDPVTDPVRTVDYEVRKGATWATAQVLGRTPNTEIAADGDGTYWVAAHSDLSYSASPSEIVIAGASLTKNVIASFDEAATGWHGSESGGAIQSGNSIILTGAGLFSAIPRVSVEPDIAYFGGVAATGIYTIPAAHEVDIGSVQACNCSVSYISRADNPFALFSRIPDVGNAASIAGNYSGLADVKVQIATSGADGVYGAWRDFVPGSYLARKFKFRACLESSDPSVIAALDGFAFSVDVPDRIDKGTAISVPAAGLSVSFATPFQVTPNIQVSVLNGSLNDDPPLITSPSTTGFNLQIKNGGTAVARTVNWLAQGY